MTGPSGPDTPTHAAGALRIGGVATLSTVDWPGELVATVFLQGCPWRCPYCHNPHLLDTRADGSVTWPWLEAFLKTREGLLDGVVFSGGEPLVQGGPNGPLAAAIAHVRARGFRPALHTGGAWPERLRAVLPLLDWVGFDMKAPFEDYDALTGREGSGLRARESLEALLESGVPHQIRTTVHPRLLPDEALDRLRADLAALGASEPVIQKFRKEGCVTGSLL
ncbi:anaerobic ribonucleoside-triphosphate reductase activating protein [Phaeovibrio sulfidiphilus]|uniref:Anaerobic ribonucleoside-triphosphate reductase activating protein n=1 Tax=Phaeovibrio sulfidiphilus TaxID=1220600 RepID=A0A8J7CVV9_9PROT|nr:anaerobic ribonucleoside-triphosphate reductase activating protein [Phaeovibrio sulfidiphilus]MBE1236766.1 anaerobic ribonucleoside-triphosphate reductase activating protein [Phaeovibrio sulfidiphilus]